MAGPLLSEIERAKRAEDLAAFARNEAAMAAALQTNPDPLTDGVRLLLGPFVSWSKQNGVRHCPAHPAAVATFLATRQIDQQTAINTLGAIELLHDLHGLANPTETAVVRGVLSAIVDVAPPRSWPAADKALFARLPPATRAIIGRREQDRDTALRRAQNESKRTEKGNDMAKNEGWRQGLGKFSKDDPGIKNIKPQNELEVKEIGGILPDAKRGGSQERFVDNES